MPSGGARLRSGPAPDPGSLRSVKGKAEWVFLPAKPNVSVPDFPLPAPSDRELELWVLHWGMPQAVLWVRDGQELLLAMYVRTFAEAELPGAATNLRTLLRQQAGELLLSMPAMLAARVRVVEDEVSARRSDVSVPVSSARDRLKAIGNA